MRTKQEIIQAVELKLQEIAICKDTIGKLFLGRDLSYLHAELGALTYGEHLAEKHNSNLEGN
jgi:hypothetical protein